jgi:hypothetical protein
MNRICKIEAYETQKLEALMEHFDPNDTLMPLWCIALQADISVLVLSAWMERHGIPYEGCNRCFFRPDETNPERCNLDPLHELERCATKICKMQGWQDNG